MKTNDIVKMGIDRTFLRYCERNGFISPVKIRTEDMIDESKAYREYTQEELEKVWCVYLYTNMGLSKKQIATLLQGKDAGLHQDVTGLLKIKEKELFELQKTIEFLKLVKMIGTIPSPPSPFYVTSYSDFISVYVDDIKQSPTHEKLFNAIEAISSGDGSAESLLSALQMAWGKDFESDMDFAELEAEFQKLIPTYSLEKEKQIDEKIFELGNYLSQKPSNTHVQEIIEEIYLLSHEVYPDDCATRWDFAVTQLNALDEESDLGLACQKIWGVKLTKFYEEALIYYLVRCYPEKFQKN